MTKDEILALLGSQMRIIPTTAENAEKLLNGEEVDGIIMGDNDILLVPDNLE